MLQVHRTTVEKFHNATDASTVRKASAPHTADLAAKLIGLVTDW